MKKLVTGAVAVALASVALATSSAGAVSMTDVRPQSPPQNFCEESLFYFESSPPYSVEYADKTWILVPDRAPEFGYWLYRDAACY